MKWLNKLPFTNIRTEPEHRLRNRLQVKAIEREIEDQLRLAGQQKRDFNQFVHSVLETLIVMRARNDLRRRK